MRKSLMIAAAAVLLCGCGSSVPKNEASSVPQVSDEQTEKATKAPESSSPDTETETEKVTTAPPETTTTTTTTTAPPLSEDTGVEMTTTKAPEKQKYDYVNGCILAYSGTPQMRAMEQYFYSSDTGAYLAGSVDKFAKKAGKGVQVYLMVIPTATELYCPEELAKDSLDQTVCTQEIYSNLKNSKGVLINGILKKHKAEYLYSRTDFHWQPLAAYYASKVFAEEAGVDFPLLDTYEAVERHGFLGGFYYVSNITSLAEYPDDFTYYKPANVDKLKVKYYDRSFNNGVESRLFFEDNGTDASYTVVLGTDDTIAEIETGVKNDRVLVLSKDSYGNALTPFLTQSFSKIYVIDHRFFETNTIDFIKKVGATDVLFAYNASSAGNPDRIALIEQLMNR
ncbi:MAG: hypothetical protein IKR76_10680 [Ruminococcus sp.]|nr:hypothetical protein [Ruminococcus sp.]